MRNYKSISVLAVLLIIGCSVEEKPESIVSVYLNAELNSDYTQAYQYLSKSDQEAYSVNKYSKMKSDSLNTMLRLLAKQSEFTIINTDTNESNAIVTVSLKSPDAEALLGNLMLSAFGGNLVDTSKISSNISKMIEADEIKFKTTQREFQLLLEDDRWKVFEDLKTIKMRNEILAEADLILTEAESLIQKQQFDNAKEKLNEIFNLDENYIQESNIEKAEVMLSKIEIIGLLELYEIESRYINTYGSEKEAGIRFKIRNNSKEDLSRVQVKVFYLDSNGNRIYDKTFNPVLVSEFSFGNNDPLKSGYIYQMPERQFYTSDEVPDEWSEGKVSVIISNVEILK